MDPADLLGAREIGDGARDAKHAMESVRGNGDVPCLQRRAKG
jgi:hypothetical protein